MRYLIFIKNAAFCGFAAALALTAAGYECAIFGTACAFTFMVAFAAEFITALKSDS